MFSILVVEDDKTLNKLIEAKLKQEHFCVYTAFDGEHALDVLEKNHVDLIISDIMMPKMNGYELIESLRMVNNTTPVLLITAKDQFEAMEEAYRVGTDDYLIKPFNMKELVLRTYALLKRAQITHEKKVKIGKTLLEYDSLTVTVDKKVYHLPPKEFYLLFKLMSNPNHIYTRIDLLDEIWGVDTEVDERTVDSHVKKLRRKFESIGEFELVSVRGLGYKIIIKD